MSGTRAGGGDYNRSSCDPPPSYLSKLWGRVGRRVWGRGGIGGSAGGGGGSQGGGDLRATHCCHMLTPKGDVCLGIWGYVCDNSAFSSYSASSC